MDTTTSTDQALRPRDVILPVAAGVLLWPPLVWFAELVTDRLASDAPATIGAVGIALVVLGPALSAALAVLVFPLAHRRRTAVAVAVGRAQHEGHARAVRREGGLLRRADGEQIVDGDGSDQLVLLIDHRCDHQVVGGEKATHP